MSPTTRPWQPQPNCSSPPSPPRRRKAGLATRRPCVCSFSSPVKTWTYTKSKHVSKRNHSNLSSQRSHHHGKHRPSPEQRYTRLFLANIHTAAFNINTCSQYLALRPILQPTNPLCRQRK